MRNKPPLKLYIHESEASYQVGNVVDLRNVSLGARDVKFDTCIGEATMRVPECKIPYL